MTLKADADEILAYMRGLSTELDLDEGRSFWPNWVYRSDHVENAANILNTGHLLCRANAEQNNLISHDSGSPAILSDLSEDHRNLVRLCFRPRTPTQHANEGFRPKNEIEYGVQMPVPIYLLFSDSLLAEEQVSFTKGRLSNNTQIGSTAEFLKTIDFRDVYHDSSVGQLGVSSGRSEILNARHSEVITFDELNLDSLRHIICRSKPERDTLLNLLSPAAVNRWESRVRVDVGDRRMFFKRGTFIERVELASDRLRFWFYTNGEVKMHGPYQITLELSFLDSDQKPMKRDYQISERPLVYFFETEIPQYQVSIYLDDNLAYFGKFDERESPSLLI